MYVLTIKDGLRTRYVGPFSSTDKVSRDLQSILATCKNRRPKWRIHSLECPQQIINVDGVSNNDQEYIPKAS